MLRTAEAPRYIVVGKQNEERGTTMKTIIFCEITAKGIYTFYLLTNGQRYYLFNQDYRKGVQEYFGKGVLINEAMNYSRSHNDKAVAKTMSKIPMYVKYIEKEYAIEVFKQTKKRNSKNYRYRELRCA